MRRQLLGFVILGGLLLLFSLATGAQAQGGDPAYVGAAECRMCHRGLSYDHAVSLHALALQDVSADPAGILADFDAGEALRTVTLPGEAEARPVTVEDIAYAIGAARYTQRYLVAAAEAEGGYLVLPAQWNVQAAEWEPYPLAESWPDPAFAWGPNCAYCHTVGLDVADYTWIDDGVMCEACHGPGSEHIALADAAGIRPNTSELADIRSAITISADPQVCGQCHSLGADIATGHPYPVGYTPGEELAAVFAQLPQDNEALWWPTGHSREVNGQYSEWLHSGHSILPDGMADYEQAQDACLACHSADYNYATLIREDFAAGELRGEPPAAVTLDNAQFAIACIQCHSVHASEADFYITVEDARDDLCAACHALPEGFGEDFLHHPTLQMIEGAAVIEQVEGMQSTHLTVPGGPDCLDCHMERLPGNEGTRATHALTPVLYNVPAALEYEAGCTDCHDDLSAAALQTFVEDTQAGTQERLDAANAALTDDTPAWVTRAVAFVAGDGSLGVHNYTYTDALLDTVEAELRIVPEVAPIPTPVAPAIAAAPTEAAGQAITVPDPIIGNLTLPAVILLGIVGAILLVGAYAFFFRGDDA